MKVMLIKPNSFPEVVEIDGSLESLQQLVGGYIEPIYKGEYIWLVNEEGNLIHLPQNIYGLVGNIVIVRNGVEDFESLTDDDIERIKCGLNG